MVSRAFAVFDIDGTLIRWQLYHAVTDALAHQGHIEPQVYQALRQARMGWKKRTGTSFKQYEAQLVKAYEEVLERLSPTQLSEAVGAVFTEYKDQVYTYTRDLAQKLKADGYLLFAISGSQTEIVSLIAEHYGFDDYVGTVYEYRGAKYTGRKTIGAFQKDRTLNKLVAKHHVGFKGSVGVGDSNSDVSMLELVEQPIAFNPEKDLFDYASSKGWKIVIERKNMVYELEKRGDDYQLVKTRG